MAAPRLHLFKTSAVLHACMVAIFFGPFTVAQPSTSSLHHVCGTAGNYTANGTYQSNLNALLPSLAANGSAAGFYSGTRGRAPDQVYGTALCRGDADASACRGCLDAAGPDLLQLCPYTKSATAWYDLCFLRNSDHSSISSSEDSHEVRMWRPMNVSDPDRFGKLVGQLMDSVSQWAAYNSSEKFGTGEAKFSAIFPRVYGLAQCTRDLTDEQCDQCLRESMGASPRLAGSQGVLVLKLRCNFRYEVYPFFSGKSMLMIPPEDNSVSPAAPTPAEGGGNRGKTRKVFAIASIAVIGALLLISMIYMCIRRRNFLKKKRGEDLNQIPEYRSLLFDLATLKNATDNFSDANKIGQGGFGAVYKGKLLDGREIAVKRLSESSTQGIEQLRNEVAFVAKLQHKNLARLLGCCVEKKEKLLVYEYIQNKSLDTYIFDDVKREELDWGKRYQVIRGIGRGLLYLHEDSCLRLVHRDLKANNILLDATMNPKISDFGLARLVTGDNTDSQTSHPVGTYGYMAPEYAMHGEVSPKSDVFSFGVLLLEIVSGQRNNSFYDPNSVANLLSYAWNCWNNGLALEFMDPCLREHSSSNEVLRCINIGLLCVQSQPKDRPNMSSVVFMLNRHNMRLQPPLQPAYFFESATSEADCLVGHNHSPESHVQEQKTTMESVRFSLNEVSITELFPR